MEIWVLLIIAINGKLSEAVEAMERRIMKIALNPNMETRHQSELVSDLINKKNMLVNLKVLYDRIEEELEEGKLSFLKAFLSERVSVDEYCLKNRCDPTEFVNRIFEYAGEGSAPLKRLRLTVGKMEEDYSFLPIVYMTFSMIKKMLNSVTNLTPGVELAFKRGSERVIPSVF